MKYWILSGVIKLSLPDMQVSDFLQPVIDGIAATDSVTWIATITAVIYVILSLRINVWCWLFGIISSVLSVAVYLRNDLPYEAILNAVYVVLGFYGWHQWLKKRNGGPAGQIRRTTGLMWFGVVISGIIGGLALGWVAARYTESSFPYADALISTFSILATWLSAKKYLSNWVVWIVADASSAAIYFIKGPELYLFGLLFIFYTFMAIAGYFSWKRKADQ